MANSKMRVRNGGARLRVLGPLDFLVSKLRRGPKALRFLLHRKKLVMEQYWRAFGVGSQVGRAFLGPHG